MAGAGLIVHSRFCSVRMYSYVKEVYIYSMLLPMENVGVELAIMGVLSVFSLLSYCFCSAARYNIAQ